MTQPTIQAGGVAMGGGAPLFLIAGPCVIESEEHARRMAAEIQQRAAAAGVPLVFKASYDKANRSSARAFRGPGLREGLRILAAIRRDYGLPVLTDVHSPGEAEAAGEQVDVIQIPAFLCRQTDLLQAAARTGRVVNVKKGQFMSPWDMRGAVEKIHAAGNEQVLLTERGASFGYNNLVVDMRSLPVLREMAPTVFDVTHSLQLPGAGGDRSGGMPQFIETLARAGVAAGVDGVFLEVHDAPERALSDGANALPLPRLADLLAQIQAVDQAVRAHLNSPAG
ncbi:MAG TPA: 3-deoxy-8-phosphooctulonate synthase [Terriglobales bacterium]|nr:3-deoxy-8-phosphooctulonate synthase [Terriglobales bacterium]